MARSVKIATGVVALSLAVSVGVVGTVNIVSPDTAIALGIDSTLFAGEVKSPVVDMPASVAAAKMKGESFYLTQSGPGRCTIASAAMVLRRAAYLQGDDNWRDVTEAAVAADGWADGLRHEFSSFGMSLSKHVLVGDRARALKRLLVEHPEGLVIYDSALPHAIVLTDCDEESGTFYCADPASGFSGKRIALADTWIGKSRGGQQGALAALSSYWAID